MKGVVAFVIGWWFCIGLGLAACLAVSALLGGCIGYGEFISPVEAQRIEREQCMRKPDAEEQRRCLSMVARKYHRYNSEGSYPAPAPSFDPRQ